jgi:transcriptional regulator with XRE-family HTH domain
MTDTAFDMIDDEADEKTTMDGPLLGQQLRSARRRKSLTLSDVAGAAGLSVSFLSLLERGKTAASLGSLARIAKALGEPLEKFIRAPDQQALVTYRGQRDSFRIDGGAVDYERVSGSFPGQQLDAVMVHLPVGFASEAVSEDGEEFVMVVSGKVWMEVGGEKLALGPQDTVHFDGHQSHRWWNEGTETAIVLWVGNAPIFKR